MNDFNEKTCPHCHRPAMKSWRDLTNEQKFLVERLPESADYSLEQRKKHRFCERCWCEDIEHKPLNA